MKIPKSYSVGGYTYNIKYFDKPPYVNGECDCENETILINPYKSQSEQERTLVHEVIHSLLIAIGRRDLNEDEDFVDTVANHLYQIIKTIEYDKK